MTAYSTIADSEIDPESPGTTTLFGKLRNNPIAITEGAAGAPSIVSAALASSVVTSDKLDYSDLIDITNSYLISTLKNIIVTGSINGWTDVTVSELSVPELYINSNASNAYIRILYFASGATQNIDSRITIDGTLSDTITTTSLTGWKWSGFHAIDVSAKSGWHNMDKVELRPVSSVSPGYDIAAVQYYFI